MKELLRSTDPTIIAFATALLQGERIACFEMDVNMSILEGGIGIFRRRLMVREGDHDAAFAILRKGALLEDGLNYDEPSGWMQPVRHALGALLLAANRPTAAEVVYREDLDRVKNNGWSLLGLEQALRAQGKSGEEVDTLVAARAKAWRRADVQPTSSCFCEPGRHTAMHR